MKRDDNLLKVNFEFRKGIFFIRFIGNLNKKNYFEKLSLLNNLIDNINFKYIVFNIDELSSIDIYGINYIISYNSKLKEQNGKLFICEKNKNLVKGIFKNKIESIDSEIEVLSLI